MPARHGPTNGRIATRERPCPVGYTQWVGVVEGNERPVAYPRLRSPAVRQPRPPRPDSGPRPDRCAPGARARPRQPAAGRAAAQAAHGSAAIRRRGALRRRPRGGAARAGPFAVGRFTDVDDERDRQQPAPAPWRSRTNAQPAGARPMSRLPAAKGEARRNGQPPWMNQDSGAWEAMVAGLISCRIERVGMSRTRPDPPAVAGDV